MENGLLHALTELCRNASKWLESHGKSKSRARFDWTVGPVQQKQPSSPPMPLTLKITNAQQIPVTLAPKTDSGRPASLDGAPKWSVISGSSTVVPAPDGLSAMLISSDNPGDTEILIDADGDLGSGVEDVSDTILLSVIGENAKNLGLTAGAPQLKNSGPVTPPQNAKS